MILHIYIQSVMPAATHIPQTEGINFTTVPLTIYIMMINIYYEDLTDQNLAEPLKEEWWFIYKAYN